MISTVKRPGRPPSDRDPRPRRGARMAICSRGWMTTRISATTSSTGTTFLKTVSGRCSSSQAPMIAPQNDAGICQRSRGPWPVQFAAVPPGAGRAARDQPDRRSTSSR